MLSRMEVEKSKRFGLRIVVGRDGETFISLAKLLSLNMPPNVGFRVG